MKGRILTEHQIAAFAVYLKREEKSENTVEKYIRDVRAFAAYMVGNLYLYSDYSLSAALLNSLVLGFAMFSIVYITIMLAAIYKQPIMSAATMILFVSVAPDIFTLFSFGKYLPTHVLTYLYQAENNYIELVIPVVGIIALAALFTIIAVKKSKAIEAAR